eukprot:7747811-Lingulodinium_polyedra.AAC.1
MAQPASDAVVGARAILVGGQLPRTTVINPSSGSFASVPGMWQLHFAAGWGYLAQHGVGWRTS